jgi:hypothetical protein
LPSKRHRHGLLLVLVLAGVRFDANVHAQTSPRSFVLVVNRNNPVETVTAAQLRNMVFAAQTKWASGRRATVVLLDSGSIERRLFAWACCRLSPAEFDKALLQSVFVGETVGGPKVVSSATAVKKFVFNVPGAIGVIDAADVDDTVRAITLDGHRPGDAGYLLVHK